MGAVRFLQCRVPSDLLVGPFGKRSWSVCLVSRKLVLGKVSLFAREQKSVQAKAACPVERLAQAVEAHRRSSAALTTNCTNYPVLIRIRGIDHDHARDLSGEAPGVNHGNQAACGMGH